MTINLNNPLVIGKMSADVDKEGKHSFTRWAESSSQEFFLKIAQYLLDGCPDLSGFVIIDVTSQMVLRFDRFCLETLGMKSKRYEH